MVPNTSMYIRPKKIKGKYYAYLVKSYRSKRPKKKRQKVIKYLGKIFEAKKAKELTLNEFLKVDSSEYFKNTKLKQILQDLVVLELSNHKFHKNGSIYAYKEYCIDIEKRKVYDIETKKEISISMNEGFLNNYTLTTLFNIEKEEGNERELGIKLANLFVSAGLKIEPEIYVFILNKILDNE